MAYVQEIDDVETEYAGSDAEGANCTKTASTAARAEVSVQDRELAETEAVREAQGAVETVAEAQVTPEAEKGIVANNSSTNQFALIPIHSENPPVTYEQLSKMLAENKAECRTECRAECRAECQDSEKRMFNHCETKYNHHEKKSKQRYKEMHKKQDSLQQQQHSIKADNTVLHKKQDSTEALTKQLAQNQLQQTQTTQDQQALTKQLAQNQTQMMQLIAQGSQPAQGAQAAQAAQPAQPPQAVPLQRSYAPSTAQKKRAREDAQINQARGRQDYLDYESHFKDMFRRQKTELLAFANKHQGISVTNSDRIDLIIKKCYDIGVQKPTTVPNIF